MAGGSGTRFWPASRPERPKQYLKLVGDLSLIQLTAHRLKPTFRDSDICVCSTQSQLPLLKEQFPAMSEFILEPEGKNTAACVALSALTLLDRGHSPETVMVTLPADHFISAEEKFRLLVSKACLFAAQTDSLVTMGVVPTYAHTGYGYIERGLPMNTASDFFHVSRFVEKPGRNLAEEYVRAGKYYWNSGMFVWTLRAIESAFEAHLPEMWSAIRAAVKNGRLAETYAKLPSLPIDVGVMEKAKNAVVIPADIGWNDVGSWSAVSQLQPADSAKNVAIHSKLLPIQSSNNLVFAPPGFEVALIDVKDLVIVVDGNRILVCDKRSDQTVREVGKTFK